MVKAYSRINVSEIYFLTKHTSVIYHRKGLEMRNLMVMSIFSLSEVDESTVS